MTVVAATLGIGLWGRLLLYGTWLEFDAAFRLNVNGWYEFRQSVFRRFGLLQRTSIARLSSCTVLRR